VAACDEADSRNYARVISHLGPAAARDPLDAPDLHAIERPAESPKPVGIADASFNAEPDRDMAGPA